MTVYKNFLIHKVNSTVFLVNILTHDTLLLLYRTSKIKIYDIYHICQYIWDNIRLLMLHTFILRCIYDTNLRLNLLKTFIPLYTWHRLPVDPRRFTKLTLTAWWLWPLKYSIKYNILAIQLFFFATMVHYEF